MTTGSTAFLFHGNRDDKEELLGYEEGEGCDTVKSKHARYSHAFGAGFEL